MDVDVGDRRVVESVKVPAFHTTKEGTDLLDTSLFAPPSARTLHHVARRGLCRLGVRPQEL
jgi:hypothetical protein